MPSHLYSFTNRVNILSFCRLKQSCQPALRLVVSQKMTKLHMSKDYLKPKLLNLGLGGKHLQFVLLILAILFFRPRTTKLSIRPCCEAGKPLVDPVNQILISFFELQHSITDIEVRDLLLRIVYPACTRAWVIFPVTSSRVLKRDFLWPTFMGPPF